MGVTHLVPLRYQSQGQLQELRITQRLIARTWTNQGGQVLVHQCDTSFSGLCYVFSWRTAQDCSPLWLEWISNLIQPLNRIDRIGRIDRRKGVWPSLPHLIMSLNQGLLFRKRKWSNRQRYAFWVTMCKSFASTYILRPLDIHKAYTSCIFGRKRIIPWIKWGSQLPADLMLWLRH